MALYLNHLVHRKQFPKKTHKVTGAGEVGLITAACVWAVCVGLYPFGFEWFNWAVPLPLWLRLAGAGGVIACFPLSVWTYRTLGVHFSTKLQLLENHELVKSGPYHFVRHPMYATFFLCAAAISLVAANSVVMATSAVVIWVMALRVRKEEAMLSARFPESYQVYRATTGAVLPMWCSR